MKFSRLLKFLFIAVISIILLLTIAAKFLSGYIENVVSKNLAELNCNIDSLDVNLLSRTVSGTRLRWAYLDDSAHRAPHQIQASRISLQGIDILRYLLYRDLHISKITAEDGNVTYDQVLKIKRKSQKKTSDLTEIQIDSFVFSNVNVYIISDTIPEYSASITLALHGIHIEDINSSKDIHYSLTSVEALAENLILQGKASLYNTTIDRVYLNTEDGKIEVDSLKMNPLKDKYEFANSLGRQKTRAVLQIPSIRLEGFSYEALHDSVFSVSTILIRDAYLSVFRDKRLPFKNPLIPLPMEMLKGIPLGLKLDTIKIVNATIEHEEIAEVGTETGKINLTELNATISNFNNRIYDDRPAFSVLTASSKFMKTGLIEASFYMPVKDGIDYEAVGKILHLNLEEINTITESVGFLRIESGFMNSLNFNFKYNEYKSKGTLDINYENLKMTILNKAGMKNEINQIKTFIINTLVKKNKDKNTPKEQRTGKIDIDRDRRRFVVNVWVKSVFAGLKSAVLPDTQEEEPKK